MEEFKCMERYKLCILTNICMLEKEDKILVIDRKKKDWPGISFPGGHKEDDESIKESVIREMKEETGLTIKNPKLIDVYEWKWENNSLYLAFLYKANEYEGEIVSSKEGEVFWINKKDINKYQLSTDFEEIFNILNNN